MIQRALPSSPWWRFLLLAGLLLGFGLRLFRLGAESLWYDETVSAVLAGKTTAALLAHTAGDIHPPGYYLLLHWWYSLVQPTPARGLEFLLAWPSVVFGLAGMALLLVVARRLFSPAVAATSLWLAAIHPFQLWYSQEVRMYTLAALCGLLCLWAMINALEGWRVDYWLALYTLSAAMGLYTLYYFVFFIVALNLALLYCWNRDRLATVRLRPRWLVAWGLAQLVILVLWLPWLPVFWRQVSNPPVPAWRTAPATFGELAHNLSEAFSALLIGHTPPGGALWPWALTAVVVTTWAFRQTGREMHSGVIDKTMQPTSLVQQTAPALLITVVLVPLALIFLISVTLTPLYHVRYLFPFATPFILLLAAALVALYRRLRWAALTVGLIYSLLAGWGLQQFWFAAQYRPDDHRGAVQMLAAAWRPGDVILVNAGWIYTALAVYWPSEAIGPFASLPPAPAARQRLTAMTEDRATPAPVTGPTPGPITEQSKPFVLVTGSVAGPPQLGWGDPASDFFAMPATTTVASLAQLPLRFGRLWHYRQYDTVSDPAGLIRDWLARNATLAEDHAITGRDYLRLQRYDFHQGVPLPINGLPSGGTPRFAERIELAAVDFTKTSPAGNVLYVATGWRTLAPAPGLADLGLSLRLYGPDDLLFVQADTALMPSTPAEAVESLRQVVLALPIPAAARPLTYTLALLVYEQASGQPLQVTQAGDQGERFELGRVKVEPAAAAPVIAKRLASFGYLDLVSAGLPAQQQAGKRLPLDLVWRPRPSRYQDTYVVSVGLRGADGTAQTLGEAPLAGWDYPSGSWPALLPVLHQVRLPLPANLPPGRYQVTLQVLRASDRQVIPVTEGRPWSESHTLEIGNLEISKVESTP